MVKFEVCGAGVRGLQKLPRRIGRRGHGREEGLLCMRARLLQLLVKYSREPYHLPKGGEDQKPGQQWT